MMKYFKYFKSNNEISFDDVVKYGITRQFYFNGFYYVSLPDQEIQEDWQEITEEEFLQSAPVIPEPQADIQKQTFNQILAQNILLAKNAGLDITPEEEAVALEIIRSGVSLFNAAR